MICVNSNSVNIACNIYNKCGGITVVLLHGMPCDSRMYEYQLPGLIAAGCKVVTIDFRGYGDSSVTSRGYGYDCCAGDLRNCIQSLGLRNICLVGYDAGGAIALRYMRLFRGENVRKLILLSACAPSFTRQPGYEHGQTKEFVTELITTAMRDRPQFCYSLVYNYFFSGVNAKSVYADDYFVRLCEDASGLGQVGFLFDLRDEDGLNDLCCVRVPCTIFYGERDTFLTADVVRLQNERIRGSKLITLPNSAHFIVYDELNEFNDMFIAEIIA